MVGILVDQNLFDLLCDFGPLLSAQSNVMSSVMSDPKTVSSSESQAHVQVS